MLLQIFQTVAFIHTGSISKSVQTPLIRFEWSLVHAALERHKLKYALFLLVYTREKMKALCKQKPRQQEDKENNKKRKQTKKLHIRLWLKRRMWSDEKMHSLYSISTPNRASCYCTHIHQYCRLNKSVAILISQIPLNRGILHTAVPHVHHIVQYFRSFKFREHAKCHIASFF